MDINSGNKSDCFISTCFTQGKCDLLLGDRETDVDLD